MESIEIIVAIGWVGIILAVSIAMATEKIVAAINKSKEQP